MGLPKSSSNLIIQLVLSGENKQQLGKSAIS